MFGIKSAVHKTNGLTYLFVYFFYLTNWHDALVMTEVCKVLMLLFCQLV